MVIEEDRVAEQHVWAEQAFLVQPLHWRHAMPAHDLLEFRNVLRAVHRDLESALARGGEAVAHQLRTACIDLHRRQHAAQAAGRMGLGGIDGGERRREVAPALLKIPDIAEPMTGRPGLTRNAPAVTGRRTSASISVCSKRTGPESERYT